jgi:hypothetical protein
MTSEHFLSVINNCTIVTENESVPLKVIALVIGDLKMELRELKKLEKVYLLQNLGEEPGWVKKFSV